MRKLSLWIHSLLGIGGIISIWYIIRYIDPTNTASIVPWLLIASLVSVLWTLFFYLLYGLRMVLLRQKDAKHINYIWIRSERQGLILAGLFGMHMLLQGFLIWNVFSATILTLVVFIVEALCMTQEKINS